MNQSKERKIEVYRDGSWVSTRIELIKRGDVFRMFEPNGQPVKGTGEYEGATEFKATRDFDRIGVPAIGINSKQEKRK